MAEARQAVTFSFNLSPTGDIHLHYDIELIRDIWHTYLRECRLTFLRLKNNISNLVFPINPWSFLVFWLGATLIMFNPFVPVRDPTFGVASLVVKRISSPGRPIKRLLEMVVVYACFYVLWLCHVQFIRCSLHYLLHYRKIMYERAGLSIKTKIWAAIVKYSTVMRKPKLYSYQALLPSLPLPSLEETVSRHLLSVRPLLNDVEYEKMEMLSTSFMKNEGRKFQRYVWLKWLLSANYVSDWWERFVYLRSRGPLLVNSNCYAMDNLRMTCKLRQTSRAANLIHCMLNFRSLLQLQQWKPMMLGDLIPLCSAQHERQFDTTRIPGVEADHLKHFKSSAHVVVLHRGRWYQVTTHYRGELLLPVEIEVQLEKIVADTAQPNGEENWAALTAGDRVHWAKTRARFFQRGGVNNYSLDVIERAAFVVTLDEAEFGYDAEDPTQLDQCAHWLLCGNGSNRWCDKSYTMIVMRNGGAGLNIEHSWADAPTTGVMWEYVVTQDLRVLGYREDGRCRGDARFEPFSPVRLRFSINEDCVECIDKALVVARSLVDDTDLVVLHFPVYGKGFMKSCKVSPDGYVQLVLQLAYFRDVGRLDLTYEATMARLFRQGRTETVRSVSIETAEFVHAMQDSERTNAERRLLLKVACDNHQHQYLDCMNGKGVDRHLFTLFVISKYTGIRSPFLEAVVQEPWRLSTSQTPIGLSGCADVNNPDHHTSGGGFGPVSEDGYGVSYIIIGENDLFFHVSSKRSAPLTDSNRFRERIRQALMDIKAIFAASADSTSFEKEAEVRDEMVVDKKNLAAGMPVARRQTRPSDSVIKMSVKEAQPKLRLM